MLLLGLLLLQMFKFKISSLSGSVTLRYKLVILLSFLLCVVVCVVLCVPVVICVVGPVCSHLLMLVMFKHKNQTLSFVNLYNRT